MNMVIAVDIIAGVNQEEAEDYTGAALEDTRRIEKNNRYNSRQ
jgi:hypothetical protein